jgi:type II secretory pathway pseudopilin PulG
MRNFECALSAQRSRGLSHAGPARQHGWALLTMVLAALLVSVSATTAFVSMRLERERERQQELLANGRTLVLALRSYHKAEWATQPEWPRDLSELVEDRRSPRIQRHLRRIPIDPITGKPEWGLLREGGRIIGVHSSGTAKTLIRRGFHPEFAGFDRALTVNEWRFLAPLEQPSRP